MKIIYSPKFKKLYKRLPYKTKLQIEQKEEIFRRDPFHPKLLTHKLSGKLSRFYAFSISYHYRIVFHFEGDNTIVLDAVGTHAVYR